MKNNRFASILLSVIVAFGLWLYVINNVSTEQERTYRGVQVTLEGESVLRERNLMIISDTNLAVQVDLKGSRSDLNNLNPTNLTLIANLDGIYDPGEYQLGYAVGFPGNVPAGAVTVMNKEPSTVTVVIAERISRSIPVKVEYIGEAAEGFIADKPQAELDNQEVTITGPRQVVEQIDHAYISVDCTDRTETITESYRFELRDSSDNPVDAAMITTNIEQIRVNVPVFLTKRLPLVLVVNPGGGATEDTSKIVIEPGYIDVSGSEMALKDLEELQLGTLNLGEIPEDMEKTFTIKLPEGVTNLSNISDAVVTVSFPELATREFTVTDIKTRNVPTGMVADLLTKQLTVTVRGPKALIEKMEDADVTVQIDLTGVEGSIAAEAKITFPSEFEGVGAVGKYSVNVKVEPKSNTEE